MKRRAALLVFALSLLACDSPTVYHDVLPELPDAGPMCGLPMPAPVSCAGLPDGDACDDNDPCTHGDACQAGVCRGDTPGRYCVRCKTDADCCAGPGSVSCEDNGGSAWAPTGKCTADGVCAMDRKGCLVGESCVPGQGCK